MVRRGWLTVAVLLLVLAACSDDDESAPTTTTAPPRPATLPGDAEPGRGFLLLDGNLEVLTVASCELEPTTDSATGVTTELRADADLADGRALVVTRSSFTAAVPTVTDTVSIVDGAGEVQLESSRAETGGRQIDLRDPNPVGSLLDIDAASGTIRAAGVFGPFGGRADDPANVDGELLLRCP